MGLVTAAVRRYRLGAWLLAAVLSLAGAVTPSAAAPPKSVLILAEGPVAPYVAELRQNLIAALRRDSAEPLNVYEELIDRIRFDSDDYDRQLLALYKTKYLSAAPALVITLTEPALDFALRHRNELFPHASVLFGAVDERVTGRRSLGPSTTGVFHHYDARATVEAALTLHPGTRQIIVVGGASRLDRGYVEVAREDLRGLVSAAAITYITDKSLSDVLAAVAALRDDAFVLFLSMQSDGDGVARTGPEVLAALRGVATVPIYGMSGNFLGRGIVGGMLFDVQSHGADLAQRARQILSGVRADELVPMRSANTLAFDWRELKRFGIEEARLPVGATVVNRELSVWEAYQRTILMTGAVLVGQSLLIGGLLLQRRRRQHSEGRNSAILRAMPDFTFLQTPAGVYLDYHAPDPGQLLLPPEQFLGRNMRDVLPPALMRTIEPAFAQAAKTREPVVVEYDLDMPQGNRRYEARLVRSNNQILTLVRDITEQKRAEAALRESAQRYALASAAGAVGVWDWNFETNEVYVDPTLKSILGFADAEITNRADDWGSRVHLQDLAAVTAQTQACIEGGIKEYEVEHRMIHKDGSVRWFLSRGSLLRRADGTPHRMVGTKVDITQRKRAEEAMRENEAVLQASHRENQDLAGRLIASQEVERARIARDLHDDLSQQLAGLSIALSGVKRRVSALPGAGDLQGDVSSLQQRTIALAENIRHLSHDLHPSVLEHAGLVAALSAYCAAISRQQTVVVTFSAEGDFESTAPDAALCLYRVAQEGLRNVITHAGAGHAEVRLRRTGDGVELTIADDGRGFDIGVTGRRVKGLGLISIRERVRLTGGSVSIVTELNKGTRVRVQVPTTRATSAAAGVSGPYATLA